MSDYEDYRQEQYESSFDAVPLGWWNDPWFSNPFLPVGGLFGGSAPPSIFPTVRVLAPTATAGDGPGEVAGPEPVSPPNVIDPDLRPTETVFEDAPGGIYETNRAPTDWDAVYDAYVILNPETPQEVDVPFHDNIDWGTVVGGILGGVLDPVGIGSAVQTAWAPSQIVGGMTTVPQMGGPPGVQAMTPTGGGCPPLGPKYAKICLATREITPLRRRRRRRLLTSSDIKDLAALKAIVGGAALQGAVVQAIRR